MHVLILFSIWQSFKFFLHFAHTHTFCSPTLSQQLTFWDFWIFSQFKDLNFWGILTWMILHLFNRSLERYMNNTMLKLLRSLNSDAGMFAIRLTPNPDRNHQLCEIVTVFIENCWFVLSLLKSFSMKLRNVFMSFHVQQPTQGISWISLGTDTGCAQVSPISSCPFTLMGFY